MGNTRHRQRRSRVVALLALVLAACAPMRPAPAFRWEPSPNYDARRPNYIILHHTSDSSVDEALATLTAPERKVSAHYLIGRAGEIVQLVDERQRAWHAGKSWWGGQTDMNSSSIGIELDNNGEEPFPDAQIDTLLDLLAALSERHAIPRANVLGHADVAPGRKTDPSAFFPWRRLAGHGFGLWCEPPYPSAPEGFDLALALTALGYSPFTPEASRQAFLIHHAGGRQDMTQEIERALASCLLAKRIEAAPE